MRLIFCSDPLQVRVPDSLFQHEVNVAQSLGIEYDLINYEALVDSNNPLKTVGRVRSQSSSTLALYRGWMLHPVQYKVLFNALAKLGIYLINDPSAYKYCHYLPESYSVIHSYTPKTVWTKTTGDISIDEIIKLLSPFGSQPVVVKDFVKSRKHEWQEACYIPSASDKNLVERIVSRFIELQGNQLTEGLVFREFIEFEPLSKHSKSGMPLTKEFRIFFLDHKPIYTVEYWEEGDYEGILPPIHEFAEVAKKVQSRFFTMDVAKCLDGDWMIIELGDGQVAGLPDNADVLCFYKAIVNQLTT